MSRLSMHMMTATALVAGAVLQPHPAVAQQPTDFTGIWKMDVEQSDTPGLRIPGPTMLEISQTEEAFIKTTRRPDESRTLTYRFDGVETLGEDGAVRTRAEWRGDDLWTHTVWRIEGMAITTNTLHTLSEDAETLTTESTLTVQHGYQGTSETAQNYSSARDVFTRVE